MKAETIHALALISLRALADYDPFEFQRTTDLSKSQVDDRIQNLVKQHQGEPEFDELQRQLNRLNFAERETDSQVASTYFLRQISLSCLQGAQALAIGHHRTAESLPRQGGSETLENAPGLEDQLSSGPDEYLRLGVMRLLRDLQGYKAMFKYSWREHEIDCVLQPPNDETPSILIDFKTRIDSVEYAQMAFARLLRLASGWGRSFLFGILTIHLNPKLAHSASRLFQEKYRGRAFLLTYDASRNEFAHESAGELLHAARRQT